MSKRQEIIEFTEDYEFNGKLYKKGHRFKVIGSSYRGLDIEDADGNCIYETLFISKIMKKVTTAEMRDEKLKDLGI